MSPASLAPIHGAAGDGGSDHDGGSPPDLSERAGSGERSTWRCIVEVLVVAAGLILVMPVLVIAAIAIRLGSPGPIVLRQERVGFHGCRFQMLKLRTMVQDAEADGRAVWAQPGDPRITWIGMVLRQSHLDEVPQLWNVLRGEMSLIGPRPERPEMVEMLSSQIPAYSSRHAVRPGITGWAQVNLRYGKSIEDAARKLEYDLYYIVNRSLRLDLLVCLRTLGHVVGLRGL